MERQHALEKLKQAGWEWVHDPNLQAHLERHAPHSLTVGSKFSQDAWNDLPSIQEKAETLALIGLANQLDRSNTLRVEVALPYPGAGTQGVVHIDACKDLSILTRTRIVRDPGGSYEQDLDVVVLQKECPFPLTHQFLAPAGVLGDTKTLGLYTLFPGEASRPFPKPEQADTDPDFHQANVEFWSSHVFLATPQEAMWALETGLHALQHKDEKSEQRLYHEQEIDRLAELMKVKVVRSPTRTP